MIFATMPLQCGFCITPRLCKTHARMQKGRDDVIALPSLCWGITAQVASHNIYLLQTPLHGVR